MENQLVKVINESGLDKTKSEVLLENFSSYFEIAADWENKSKMLVVTDVMQIAEMKMAREGRLFLKEKRVAVEKIRKQLKKNSLREGQTIDAIAKILTNLILPIEEDLERKERFREIKEAEELARKTAERIELLIPFNVAIDAKFIGQMPDESFNAYLTGLRVEKEQREAAEKKAEQERIAKEKAEAEERERIRLENERLRKENEAKEKQLLFERRQAEELAEKERKANAEKLKAQQEAARIQAEKAAKEKAKLETELKAKEDAVEKVLKEAAAKAEAERKEKEKAAKAPDKVKLTTWVNSFNIETAPETSDIFNPTKNVIEQRFEAFKTWAKSKIENI